MVYRVSDAGDIKRLFQVDGLAELSAIADVDGDVLLLGSYGDFDFETTLNAELARYEPNGKLVWRQAALRASRPGAVDDMLLTSDMPMVMDAKGRAVLASLAWATVAVAPNPRPNGVAYFGGTSYVRAYNAIQVGSDGNIRWVAGEGDHPYDTEPAHEPGAPRLVRDTRGRFVLAEGAYAVVRFEQQGATVRQSATADERSPGLARRMRDEYWEPVVLGLASDASDRVLVATQSGTKDARRLLIDRISADFGTRETFVLPQAFAMKADSDNLAALDDYANRLNAGGIDVAPDQTVIAWNSSTIARFALP
jgi:hypothetical protein